MVGIGAGGKSDGRWGETSEISCLECGCWNNCWRGWKVACLEGGKTRRGMAVCVCVYDMYV